MRIRGLFLSFLVAVTIVFVFLFIKTGKEAPVRGDVDRFIQAESDLTRANMQVLQQIIASYIATEGQPPAGIEDVRRAGMLTGSIKDAWGRDIRYERRSDSSFRLISAGKDGIFDTADDIRVEY
jgi:hypothetical protein